MIARRELLGTAMLSSVMSGGGTVDVTEKQAGDMIAAIKDLKTALDNQRLFNEITRVRERMVEFLRSQGKFPDFIEVGSDLWMDAYDWHVRHLQPLNVGRDLQGRYTLAFMATTLILRPESNPNFMGPAYDNR
ncbi:MAG TPA: hypothetical protein VFA59_14175 [Vicinamibacterales bacterium]|nr:hypothetical protein [Vicinamibacterales bacterium]